MQNKKYNVEAFHGQDNETSENGSGQIVSKVFKEGERMEIACPAVCG